MTSEKNEKNNNNNNNENNNNNIINTSSDDINDINYKIEWSSQLEQILVEWQIKQYVIDGFILLHILIIRLKIDGLLYLLLL